MNERTDLIIDKDKREIINNTLFVIAGLGGVGGTALEIVLRFGCVNFFLIDGDIFEESNLNRQILSSLKNIGELKTESAKNHILDIQKNAKIETFSKMIREDNIQSLCDMVMSFYSSNKLEHLVLLDCIDDVRAKVLLYKAFINTNAIIVSSMGAGRTLSSPLEVAPLLKTHSCPLARAVRIEAKKHLTPDEMMKITTVFSPLPPHHNETNGIIPSCVIQPFSVGVRIGALSIKKLLGL